MGIATRRPVWRDGPDNGWHDELIWYAAAVHRMRALTPRLDDFFDAFVQAWPDFDAPLVTPMADIARQWDDPRSLGYQSQVHGTFVPRSRWPAGALWQECAHNHWFFLPWHRAYLLEFEAVVREHVRELGGPADDWALPYWNYSDDPATAHSRGLPLPLQGDTLPDGVEVPGVDAVPDGRFPNLLFIPLRLGPDTTDPGTQQWADASTALLRPHYANQQDTANVSFAGGVIEQANDPQQWHGLAQETGMVDAQPHGSVHGAVNGAMALFQTAGLDPVFWLHHCNVDRLWETYAHDLGHGYPFENGVAVGTKAHESWKTHVFRFLRPDRSTAEWTAPQLLDVSTLGHVYDTTAPPPLPSPSPVPGSEDDPIGLTVPDPQPIAEAGPLPLAEQQDVAVTGGGATDQGVGVAAFGGTTATWLLRFEGIRSARPAATSYRVYLGLAPGEPADSDDADHYAGLLSLFGVFEASRDDGSSAGSGQRRVLDVTALVAAQQRTLRPLATSVRLVPLDPDRDLTGMRLTIDRISLDVA